MDRLTTNNPKGSLKTAYNLFYIKGKETWVVGGGPGPDYKDISLYDFIIGYPLCSNCGIEAAESDDEEPITGDYCCHCGALMDGKDDSHETD